MAKTTDYEANCPTCGQKGKFIPPTKIDKNRRKVIVTFECPLRHVFKMEFDVR